MILCFIFWWFCHNTAIHYIRIETLLQSAGNKNLAINWQIEVLANVSLLLAIAANFAKINLLILYSTKF